MKDVVFLDSSILLNVLDVPGKNSDRDEVSASFRQRVDAGSLLVIPVAAVVEVGNHIAQLPGSQRRALSSRFAGFLKAALDGSPPWVLSGGAWDRSFLHRLVAGDQTRPGLTDLATQGIGSGDASILVELAVYRARTDLPGALPVRLWTLDKELEAWA